MDEDLLPDADLWEKKRQEGLTPEAATAYVQGRRKPALPGGVNTFVQGATMGFGDELTAAARALPRLMPGGETFGHAYDESVGAERRGLAGYRKAHPVLAGLTEIGGAIAGNAALLGGTGLGAAVAKSAPRAIAMAAGEGALSGAGAADGSIARRAAGGATGAVTGAALGLVAPVAGRVGGAALDVSGLRGPVSRVVPMVETAEERGGRAVLEAIKRSGKSLDDVEYALTPSQTGKTPISLMDAMGEEGSAQAMYVGNRPGPGRQVVQTRLRGRSAGQSGRVAEALAEETKLGKPNAFRALEEMDAERAKAAAPLYAKLENVSVKDPDQTFTSILQDPAFYNAYQRAQRIAQREGYKVPDLYDEAGNFRGDKTIPVKVFDYLNRGLRDMSKSEVGFGPDEWRSIQGQRAKLLAAVDELVPEFKQARSVYAGKSALMDATELGAELFKGKTDPAEIAAVMKNMSESEREFFRKGALSTLLGNMEEGRDTWDAIPRLLGAPRQRERLRVLFPDQGSFERFLGRADLEGAAERGAAPVLGGSRTEPMRLAGRDFETGAARDLAAVTDQGPVRAAVGALRRALFDESAHAQNAIGEAAGTAGELLTRGATHGSGTARSAVGQLRGLETTLAKRAALGAGARASVGGTMGAMIGGTMGGAAGAASQRVDEGSLPDADLWELKVSQGLSPAQATIYVQRRSGSRAGAR